jgi:hypothetical protein
VVTGDDPIWKIVSTQVMNQPSTGLLGRSHLRPIKVEVTDIFFTAHKKTIFLIPAARP